MNTDAVKVLAKTAPLKFSIESVLARGNVNQIPKIHRKKMKSLLAEIKKLEVAAQATVSQQSLLKVDMSEVMTKCLEAQNHVTLFVSMLNSLG